MIHEYRETDSKNTAQSSLKSHPVLDDYRVLGILSLNSDCQFFVPLIQSYPENSEIVRRLLNSLKSPMSTGNRNCAVKTNIFHLVRNVISVL